MSSRARVAIALAVSTMGCTSGEPSAKAPDPHAEYHPPWPPGASITQSKTCECTTCTPASCCSGSPEDEPSSSGGESGGLSVMSCTPRCTRLVWRVSNEKSCDARRPEACCAGAT